MVAAYPSNYLLLLLVIVVGTASVAQANITIGTNVTIGTNITIGGVNVSGVVVNGVFAFTANPTAGVAGVNITLSCDGGNTTIGTSAYITGSTGAFRVGTTTGNGTLFAESKCAVYASIVSQADVTVSASLTAPLLSLTIQAGVQLVEQNGQITLVANTGSSTAIYVAGSFVPVA